MKIMLYITLAAVALAVPKERADVGKLRPVEVVSVAVTDTGYTVRTDTGDWGTGNTMQEAVNDLMDRAPGTIYMDTAEYLILETGTGDLEYLKHILKPGVRVCAGERDIRLEGSGLYLDVHRPKVRLNDGIAYDQMEYLWCEKDSYLLQ